MNPVRPNRFHSVIVSSSEAQEAVCLLHTCFSSVQALSSKLVFFFNVENY